MITWLAEIGASLLVGLAGGVLAHKLRLPGGTIIGALVAVAILHVAIPDLVALGPEFRTAAQIAIGCAIGVTLTRSPLKSIYAIIGPALLVITILLATSIGLAFAMAAVTDLPLVTSLFALAPGGASDMAAAALNLDADVGAIAAIHVVRQITVFVIVVGAFTHFLTPKIVTGTSAAQKRGLLKKRRQDPLEE